MATLRMRELTDIEVGLVCGAGDETSDIVVTSPLSKVAIDQLGQLADWYLFADLLAIGYAVGETGGGIAGLGFGVATGNPISATALKNQIWDGLIEMYRETGTAPDDNGIYIPGGAIPY